MKLKSYIKKRKLKESPEPKGKIFKHKKGDLAFVIQKHAASHLHYDFRLEADGVLKSWAVPKGPSLDPEVKRLAMMVEDHPYDYRNFEGIIPSGYGAGTVMIWDQGTYQVEGESSKQSEERILEGLKKGVIHFTLKGAKLRGSFSLIRLKKEGNEWLLIKSRDDFATKANILLQDRSVISHQTLEEIGGNFSKKSEKKQQRPQLIKPMLTSLSGKPTRSVVEEKKEPSAKIFKILGKSKGLEKFDFLTHLDKMYWEEEQISKGELLLYYISIADYILPYLKDRPESLRRFPNGISQSSFFQKNIESCPEWVDTIRIKHNNRVVNYMIIQNLKSLLYAVNLGCIEIHPWFSSIKSLENPDFMIFDLDPVEIEFDAVIETALALHALLEKFSLPHFCKTSGSRGLHIGIPLKAKYSYEQAKQFAELIALMLHQHIPEITSLKRSPSQRKRKVYIDCYQNNFAQTLAAPYSVRAKPGAPVSTPLEWSEVKKGLNPLDFTIFNTVKRLKKKGDLFKPILSKGINLAKTLIVDSSLKDTFGPRQSSRA